MRLKIVLLATLITAACANSRETIPTTPGVLNGLDPIPYYYGDRFGSAPCEDAAGRPLPDPDNSCDTPETVKRIIVLNAKIRAGQAAASQ